ncbi:MAG: CoA transferase [Sphingobium sp.]|uniref:CaiB/BaiF CoA transferase family protein n=1 Tax=Sphingobium sp. TaxID=1912891 RepID=UPI000C43A0B8|nr:CaiB/BaiF CoA-transferase family protein [Sphingobium sp.]MBU0659018.1 CoA transferase [Alphaproteobacteria bacterium]MBS89428.1 carnitine dehydratase [Sphingobium sp.]MBU0775866.1 CoA transferase [Alphaproteobacteria bacterium]MBU0869595.1 CoA transferase [Alphaproteobacteria bacterium]MBU1259054.1 CoA transferase [Alphaproteobacteria bacterium]
MADDGKIVMAGALDGVRVLDFTSVMAGPFATRMLADLGADVIKVESLEGDQVRARPPKRDGHSAYFGNLNAGKQSIACNLKSPEIIALMKQLVATCDVLVENFRPGVMVRFGLDFATLAAINPRLIYCSISGYGQTGPKALFPAYAPVIHAASGFDMVNLRYQDGADRPATSGIFIADVLGGTHAFGAIQAALYQRERTGQGQHIDLSMLEAMVGMLVFETQEAQFPGDARRPLYTPLKTNDGFIMVAPTSPRNFEQLSDAVGHPEWRDDPRFLTNADRNANWATLLALTEAWTIERSAAEAEAILSRHGVPCARYREIGELLDDPQLAARGAFAQVHDGAGTFKVPNPPFRMSGSRVEARDHVARLGEDGATVLAGLGLSAEVVAALRASGDLG